MDTDRIGNQGGDGVYLRLVQRVAAHGREPAVVVDGRVYDYATLLGSVHRVAAGLQAAGCSPGDRVMLMVPNGIEFVVSVFAIFAIDAVLVPLNHRFTQDEIEFYLESSGAKFAVVMPPLLGQLGASLSRFALTYPELHRTEAAGFQAPSKEAPEAGGLMMFSSGSTGKPKGVLRTQAAVLAELACFTSTTAVSECDRVLCTVPLYHAHGFCNCMMAALLNGGRLVILTNEFNARTTLRTIEREEITIYPTVPFMVRMMAEARCTPSPNLASLRLVFSAGAPLGAEVTQAFHDRYGLPVSQLYGSTETGAVCLNLSHPTQKPASVGRPLVGVGVRILADDGGTLPVGETGEVWLYSPGMAQRYERLPEATAECFRNGYFNAGDMGYLDADGALYITGRKKTQINVAGYKVDPTEVETVLGSHDAVAEVVVVGVPDPQYGECVKAAVVLKDGAHCTPDEIAVYARRHLAEYKVPKLVEFRETIPRSPLGKVLRKYLI